MTTFELQLEELLRKHYVFDDVSAARLRQFLIDSMMAFRNATKPVA